MYFGTIIFRDCTLPRRYILMRATAALSGDRGICRDHRRLARLFRLSTCYVREGWTSGPYETLNKRIVLSRRILYSYLFSSSATRRRPVTRFLRMLKNVTDKMRASFARVILTISLVKSGPPSFMPPTSTKDERKKSRVERPSLSISSQSKINLKYNVFIKSAEDQIALNSALTKRITIKLKIGA